MLTRQGAIAEVVANASSKMLVDTKAIEALAKENHGLFSTIKGWVKNFVSDVQKALSTNTTSVDTAMEGVEYMQVKADNELQYYSQ